MSFQQTIQLVPVFVLVFFRMAGMVMAAPFFGGARVPRRVKVLLALVLAVGIMPAIGPMPRLPATTLQFVAGITGELLFGLAIGTALSFTFVAVHWAGEIIGQQMGLGIGEVFDPQFGGGGSVVSDLYYMLTLVIFLLAGGHRAFLRGVSATFTSLPLLSAGMNQGLLDMVVGLLQSATILAMSLAAPILITMLIVEVVLGFISKTIPQVNVLTAGLSIRSLVGMLVLLLSAALTSQVIQDSMIDAMRAIGTALTSPFS